MGSASGARTSISQRRQGRAAALPMWASASGAPGTARRSTHLLRHASIRGPAQADDRRGVFDEELAVDLEGHRRLARSHQWQFLPLTDLVLSKMAALLLCVNIKVVAWKSFEHIQRPPSRRRQAGRCSRSSPARSAASTAQTWRSRISSSWRRAPGRVCVLR